MARVTASRALAVSGALVVLAIALGLFELLQAQAAVLGRLPLWQRATLSLVPCVQVWCALWLGMPWLRRRTWLLTGAGLIVLGLPFAYYLVYLPARAGEGVAGRQLASALITEGTSNGIIEVGFAYPIFTPTVELTNQGLFTARYELFLRMTDANGEVSLFRAVRAEMPDQRLTVEASVSGLLSEAPGYLFNPVEVPPHTSISGRIVFIISNLRDGTTFNDALGSAFPGQFEVRAPDSGELLASFPLNRL